MMSFPQKRRRCAREVSAGADDALSVRSFSRRASYNDQPYNNLSGELEVNTGAMIAGMHAKGVNGETIWVSDPHPEKREKLHALYGAVGFEGAGEWLKKADVVVLAVKPQKLKDCCETLKPFVSEKALVLSVAAGVKLEVLRAWLNHKRIVRAIPNTPAMVLKGFSGLYVPSDVDEDARKAAHAVLESVGEVKDLTHEDGLHLVTSGPGSGPAYVFLFMEALAEALVKGGASQVRAAPPPRPSKPLKRTIFAARWRRPSRPVRRAPKK